MPATNYSSVTCNGDTPQIFLGGPTGAPVSGDPVVITRSFVYQATAVASNSVAVPLPLGARICYVQVNQQVAPTGTTPSIALGSTSAAVDIAAATNIGTALQTVVPLSLVGTKQLTVANFASIVATSAGGSVIYVTYTQGTPTAVGTLFIQIDYEMA